MTELTAKPTDATSTDEGAGTERLRVLHVIYKVQPTNGQFNEHCLPLAEKRDITVCSFRPSSLTIPPSIRSYQGTGSLRSGWRTMAAAVRAHDYDVIHVHAPQTAVILLTVLAGTRRWKRRAAAVYTVQNSYGNYKPQNRVLMALAFPWFPQVVFCSESARSSMPSLLRRLIRGRSHVVANCVDLTAIDAAIRSGDEPPAPRTSDAPRVVVLGRLMPIKDVATVIHAVAAFGLDDLELVIVGDGPLRAELEATAAREHIKERTTFTGLVDRAGVYRQLAASDVCVSASHGEGLPVAVIEALACGCPAVLTDIPPHRELSEGLDAVRLFPVGNASAAAEHLRVLAALTVPERAELGGAGRAHVERHFSLDAMHRAYVPIYTAAAGRPFPTLELGGPRSAP